MDPSAMLAPRPADGSAAPASTFTQTVGELGGKTVSCIRKYPWHFTVYIIALITVIAICSSPILASNIKLGIGVTVGGIHLVVALIAIDRYIDPPPASPHPLPPALVPRSPAFAHSMPPPPVPKRALSHDGDIPHASDVKSDF